MYKKKLMYVTPQIKVVIIKQSHLLCTSPGASTEQLDEEDFEWDS